MRALRWTRCGGLVALLGIAIVTSSLAREDDAKDGPPAAPKTPAEEPATRPASRTETQAPRKGKLPSRPPATREAAPGKRAGAKQESRDRSTAAERSRWSALPEERRQAIQQIYDRIRDLPPAQRKALLESLKALDASQRQSVLKDAAARSKQDPIESKTIQARTQLLRGRLSALSPQERERLRSMSAEERKRFFQERAAVERERQLEALPAREREALRDLSPREQTARIRQIKGRQVLEDTFREPREVAALKRLPPRELVAALRADPGPTKRPPFVSPPSWKRWLALKPYEQTRVLRTISSMRQPPPSPRSPSSAAESRSPVQAPLPSETQK